MKLRLDGTYSLEIMMQKLDNNLWYWCDNVWIHR